VSQEQTYSRWRPFTYRELSWLREVIMLRVNNKAHRDARLMIRELREELKQRENDLVPLDGSRK
jgi:hypothetical protein